MTDHLISLDYFLRAWVVTHRVHALDGVMWTLSAVGRGGLVWLLIGAGLAVWGRLRWRDFARLVLAVLMAALVANQILKPAIQRERPFVGRPEVPVIGGLPSDESFPSGHAANALPARSSSPGCCLVDAYSGGFWRSRPRTPACTLASTIHRM